MSSAYEDDKHKKHEDAQESSTLSHPDFPTGPRRTKNIPAVQSSTLKRIPSSPTWTAMHPERVTRSVSFVLCRHVISIISVLITSRMLLQQICLFLAV